MKKETVEGFYELVRNACETQPNFSILLEGYNIQHEDYIKLVEWIKTHPIKYDAKYTDYEIGDILYEKYGHTWIVQDKKMVSNQDGYEGMMYTLRTHYVIDDREDMYGLKYVNMYQLVHFELQQQCNVCGHIFSAHLKCDVCD